ADVWTFARFDLVVAVVGSVNAHRPQHHRQDDEDWQSSHRSPPTCDHRRKAAACEAATLPGRPNGEHGEGEDMTGVVAVAGRQGRPGSLGDQMMLRSRTCSGAKRATLKPQILSLAIPHP